MAHASLHRWVRDFARARLRTRRSRVISLLAAASAVIGAPFVATYSAGSIGHEVASLPTAVADAAADVASAAATVATGRHLGFDTSEYPGDAVMRSWRQTAPYEWVGYYLPAPCHKDASWSGKRETLAAMNWGTAVIYVGQQTWGRTPGAPERRVVKVAASKSKRGSSKRARTRTRVVHVPAKVTGTCDADLVSAKRGVIDADDAIAKTLAEGFPTGTVVFLDIEHMDRIPQAMRDYYTAWTERVLADGRLRPGFYAHTRNAARIYADVQLMYAAAGVKEEPPFWIAGARDFSPEKKPADVGHAFAAAWQGILDRVVSHGGVSLPIDVSVASAPSPSDAFVATANSD